MMLFFPVFLLEVYQVQNCVEKIVVVLLAVLLWFKGRLACSKNGTGLRYTDEEQIYKTYTYFRS